jgi:hypothetical protein
MEFLQMGKGKKASGKNYVSKGIVGTTKSRSKNDPDYALRRLLNQQKAWREGRNVVLTVPNPNSSETNRQFIKVNARDVWGDPKRKVSPVMT